MLPQMYEHKLVYVYGASHCECLCIYSNIATMPRLMVEDSSISPKLRIMYHRGRSATRVETERCSVISSELFDVCAAAR